MSLNEVLVMHGYESALNFEESAPDPTGHVSDYSPIHSSEHTYKNNDSPHSLIIDTSPESGSNSSDEKFDFKNLVYPKTATASCSRSLLRSVHQASESSNTGTDYEYTPDDDWRMTIRVGSDYQAVVPEGLSQYDDAPPYENEDRLLWDPTALSDEEVVGYLRQCQQLKGTNGNDVATVPTGSHVRDDEHALFLLFQCGHDKEEALRRRNMLPCPVFVCISCKDTMSLWSEDECRSFETGIKIYGKKFNLIQQNMVRTRDVSELVQFYYLWKKTERHDVFACKNRIKKKKYALHPGTTDFMDRFLDEQENSSSNRDRSSSHSSRETIYDENKKTTPFTSPEVITICSSPDLCIQSPDNLDGPTATSLLSTDTISDGAGCENSPN